MKKKTIKYEWALFDNNLVHISEVTHEMRELQKFRSPVSNEPMTAYLDGKFKKHFHHLNQNTNYCNETYLHETGKYLFYRKYNEALNKGLPYFLEYEQEFQCQKTSKQTSIKCDIVKDFEEFDLTKKFKYIKLESYHNGLKPDIILLSEDEIDVIYIEIAVTHESSEQKIDSGNRIIEIKLNSEIDLDLLKGNRISMKDIGIEFHNFKSITSNVEHCPTRHGYCRTIRSALKIKNDGNYEFIEDTLGNLSEIMLNDETSEITIYEEHNNSFLNKKKLEFKKLKDLSEQGVKVRDCRVCQNSITDGLEWEYSRLYCKSYKMKVRRNLAAECEKIR